MGTLKFERDSSFLYSNSNYAILVDIIEIASGESYSQFVKNNIFCPLQMKRSFIKTDKNAFAKGIPGFIKNDATKKYELPDTLNSLSGSPTRRIIGGGIFSTSGDIYKWDQALYTNKLVSQTDLKEIFKPPLLLMTGLKENTVWAGTSITATMAM